MKVKIKKTHENAKIPKYAHATDAGMDLTATSKWYDKWSNICYGTGIALEIPDGYYGQIVPRSSISKTLLILANSPATIDSNYRGEIMLKFKRVAPYYKFDGEAEYQVGDRIAQLIIKPYEHIEFEEVDNLSESDRGDGGFGSTGR